MTRTVVLAALLALFLGSAGCKDKPQPDPQDILKQAAKPEWNLTRLIETVDDIQWKGDWVASMVPSPMGQGPSILCSLIYNWRDKQLVFEIVAYQKNDSLRELSADSACQGIFENVKGAFEADPAHQLLAKVMQALQDEPFREEPGRLPDEGWSEKKAVSVVKVSIQSGAEDKAPFEEISSCERFLEPGSADEPGRTVAAPPSNRIN
ncbi:MAG: hypothetical protein AB1640_03415 [bacterium]